jgi:hypothetical protein
MNDADTPIQIGDGIWWVGSRLIDDSFQCHAYFIENGTDSVLIDPGSPLTIKDTLSESSPPLWAGLLS